MTREAEMTERLDWRTVFIPSGETPPEVVDALDRYFWPFAQPRLVEGEDGKMRFHHDHPCLKCGSPLLGLASQMTGGGFTWGLLHGEGHCGRCGWPARAHHDIKMLDGRSFLRVNYLILQYHPDVVEQ